MVNQDSVLHGNDVFVNKLLSRWSLSSDEQFSPPRKSESYNCKLPGRVPFKWELKPGIPIDSPNEGDSSSIPLESSLRLKKIPILRSNNHQQNQIIKKRATFTGPNKTSWPFKRPKKALKKSAMMFSYSKSSNSDHGYFSSSSTCTSKLSSSSTSAATESPNSPKALAPSSPMPSRLRSLAKRLLQRLF